MIKNYLYKFAVMLIGICVILLFPGCPPPAEDPPPDGNGTEPKEIASRWTGSFTYSYGVGTIVHMTLYKDDTLTGRWIAGDDTFSLSVTGSCTLNETDFSFEASGTATSDEGNSVYTGSGSGSLWEDDGFGTYSMDFSHPDFEDQNDEFWNVERIEEGGYTIETFSNGGSPSADTYMYLLDSDQIELAHDDDGGSYLYSRIVFSLESGSTYYVIVEDFFSNPGYYSLRISETGGGSSSATPAEDEGEPDNDADSATVVTINTVYDRYLSLEEVDWFFITVP